tara:strand:- start:1885 stop:2505 length:621 start_codon:yes stop_codon:yes gene_type:complete
VTEEFRQCRRSSRCRESLPVSQLKNESGKWVCEVGKCPRYTPRDEESVCVVEKRYLNIAKIMFLSSDTNGQNPEDFAENFASRLEELTEEIIDLNVEVYPLNGGFVGHAIEGTELVPKRASKHNFRKAIFDHWESCCAYCGEHADTLDHVVAMRNGGLTVKGNLVSCCRRCNGSKGASDIWHWYTQQPFFSELRSEVILEWLSLNQ